MTRNALSTLFLLALLVALPSLAEAGLGCAQFITSARRDGPRSGHLIGDEVIEKTREYKLGGRLGTREVSLDPVIGETVSRTYSVGIYQMADGRRLKLDCRDYSEWG